MSNYGGQGNYGLHAVCNFDADAAAAAFRQQRGFAAAFVRNGAGDYSLALSEGIAQTQACIQLTTNAGVVSASDAQWVDATHIRVRTSTDAGVATDMDFSVVIHDMGPS